MNRPIDPTTHQSHDLIFAIEPLADANGFELRVICRGEVLSYRHWLAQLLQNAAVRSQFTATWRACSCPPSLGNAAQ